MAALSSGSPIYRSLGAQPALHQKSGSHTAWGSSVLNEPPLLVVDCNFGAKPAQPFESSIGERENDKKLDRSFAFLLALLARLVVFPYLHWDLIEEKGQKEKQLFKSIVDSLNEGWLSGSPPRILYDYMSFIERTSDGIDNAYDRLRGRSSVANVKYLLGDWKGASELAKDNWKLAEEHEAENDPVLKWMASYVYYNTTLFLDGFASGMGLMTDRWNQCYMPIPEGEKKDVLNRSNHSTLNPILAIPRNLILAAAFKGSPMYERQYWPEGEYDKLAPNQRESERKWVESWYKQAQQVCQKAKDNKLEVTASRDFSHAYTGFYFTLLYLDCHNAGASTLEPDWHKKAEKYWRRRAEKAFKYIKIGEESPVVSRYAKSGFLGIFKLVTEEDPKKALQHLREAAQYSEVSGNRFGMVDLLFKCCHAVAAQRVEQKKADTDLQPEVDEYLKEAERAAKGIGHHFYSGLYAAARSEVNRIRGYEGRANRLEAEAKNKMGQAGKRILWIFRIDEEGE